MKVAVNLFDSGNTEGQKHVLLMYRYGYTFRLFWQSKLLLFEPIPVAGVETHAQVHVPRRQLKWHRQGSVHVRVPPKLPSIHRTYRESEKLNEKIATELTDLRTCY